MRRECLSLLHKVSHDQMEYATRISPVAKVDPAACCATIVADRLNTGNFFDSIR